MDEIIKLCNLRQKAANTALFMNLKMTLIM
jgi:hypothetical protein